jgi:hypothetical protein
MIVNVVAVVIAIVVVGDAQHGLIFVFVVDPQLTPHEFAIYLYWLIAQNIYRFWLTVLNDVVCHSRRSGTGREHRCDQSGHQQEQERTPQVLPPSLWKGFWDPSLGGFVPPETVTEKKDWLNGGLRTGAISSGALTVCPSFSCFSAEQHFTPS